MEQAMYPVQFSVDYPDRPLDRVTTCFRLFMVIPIAIMGLAYLITLRRPVPDMAARAPVVAVARRDAGDGRVCSRGPDRRCLPGTCGQRLRH